MERTSIDPELLRGAQDRSTDEIFRLADMAKFAKSRPLPDQNKRAMELAVQWVTETTPDNEPKWACRMREWISDIAFADPGTSCCCWSFRFYLFLRKMAQTHQGFLS